MVYQQDVSGLRWSRALHLIGPLTLSTLVWGWSPRPQIAQATSPGTTQITTIAPSPGRTDKFYRVDAPRLDKQLEQQIEGTATRPPVPMLPDSIPDPIDPDPDGIVGLHPDPDQNMGIGHLRPDPQAYSNDYGSDPVKADWLRGVVLPIYAGPNGELWGWLINGWLMTNGYDPIAIGRDATFSMVEAEPGLYSFPVLTMRDDGWFSFQYTPAGVAWTHVSQLDIGPTHLTIEPWSDQLQHTSQIEFRKHGVSQPLREQPDTNQPLISLVSPQSVIEPLAVEGDWLRVRVTQPAAACKPLAGANSEEGWMRWRDPDQTLLVWFLPRGC